MKSKMALVGTVLGLLVCLSGLSFSVRSTDGAPAPTPSERPEKVIELKTFTPPVHSTACVRCHLETTTMGGKVWTD
jgi:hypothetical protein